MENQNDVTTKNQNGVEISVFIPNTESIAQLKELEPQFSLVMKYKSADDWAAIKDKPVRCYFLGLKNIPNEHGELINCGVFMTIDEVFISGPMLLVDAVRNLKQQTPVEIIYRGKKSNKTANKDGNKGSTMIFDVSTLS